MRALINAVAPRYGKLVKTATTAATASRVPFTQGDSVFNHHVSIVCGCVRWSSSNSRWKQRQGKDYYAREAKVKGLKSRAAFKLLEMDAKYRLFKRGQTIIDLGYAPGSWSQVAVERTKPNGRVVGIDIIPAQPPKGVSTIQGNFLSPAVQNMVKEYLVEYVQQDVETPGDEEGTITEKPSYIDAERADSLDHETSLNDGKLVDVVLSDMSAPWSQTSGFSSNTLSNPYYRMMNTSGMSFRDHAGSMDLCLAALQFASDTLRVGGHFICKFYQGSEDKALELKLRKMFGKVHREKPDSSRTLRSMSLNQDPWAYARPPLASSDDLHDVCLNDDTHNSRSPLPPGSRPECLKNLIHELLFVALIALAAATPVFLQRSIVVVTSSIAESLRMSPAELAWSTASAGLTTGAFLLPFGHIADTCAVLPRKALLVISLATFALLTAGTSLSQTGVVLDVLSGLTGVACAANVPIALGILSLVYPENSRRRNMVFSSFFMGTPTATIIGGLGSGGLALKISWKAPFIALGGLFAVISVLTWVFIPNVPEPEIILQKSELRITTDRNGPQVITLGAPKRITTIMQFDWAGLALLIMGVLLFTVSLTIGPEGPEPWKTPTVILLLTLGLLFLGCFILWQNVSKHPIIPPSLWSNWSVTLVVVCTLGASMSFYSQLFWVSMFMQQVENLNSFEVAVRLLPQALVGLLLSPLVGLFMHAIPGTALLTFAALALVLSNIFLVFLRHNSHYLLWIFPSLMLSTIGMDWVMNVGSLHILSSLPPEHHSIGASLLQTTSRLGVPLGLAITTSIWSSYDGNADWSQPELAYTHTFISTTAFSALSLLLVPFIRIGKQGVVKRPSLDSEVDISSQVKRGSLLLSTSSLQPTESDKGSIKDVERRPSKRWSPVGSMVPSSPELPYAEDDARLRKSCGLSARNVVPANDSENHRANRSWATQLDILMISCMALIPLLAIETLLIIRPIINPIILITNHSIRRLAGVLQDLEVQFAIMQRKDLIQDVDVYL
ncbi:hypothetical protein GQX73_g7888 [Xylaria multiplex]|uniref:Major facilitator superfamily (MFS) profile domain-containing protein n=1 Tax=Xylaria multiplex TaxID=323545 RepID=A0A7C8MPQ4_9PEZI|nr:hypothetical protein GQX73_g7888 [Xylaria multiplex]